MYISNASTYIAGELKILEVNLKSEEVINFYLILVTFLIKAAIFMSADLSVSSHYVITLRRGRTRPRTREQLLLQNYKA